MAEFTTRRYPNLFFLSNFDRDDHAVAEAMSNYNARSYADIDYANPAALLEEARLEYDAAWRGQDGVFVSCAEAEAAAPPGRHVAEVSLELLASQIAYLAFQGRHADEDDSDVLEAGLLGLEDVVRRVRALVEEQGLR